MDIIPIDQSGHSVLFSYTPEDKTLRLGKIFTATPFNRAEWYLLKGLLNLLLGRPPGCPMLTIAYRFGLDIVQRVLLRQKGDTSNHKQHDCGDTN